MNDLVTTIAVCAAVLIVLMVAGVLGALCTLLQSVARHRDAQADSVLHHAGLLDREET